MTTYQHARRLAEKTPSDRNRYVDFLRAASILVVVLGHWLMAAPQMQTGDLQVDFLLSAAPWTGYLTWVLQVMPIFFLVGGYANAVSWRSSQGKGEAYGAWLRARLRRLLLPVLPLLAVWTVGAYVLLQSGLDPELIRIGSQGAFIPVWFLATYVMVVALTPVTLRAWDRFGWKSLIATGALAGLMDLISLGSLGLADMGFLNYLFVWGTVHGLGYAWADSRIGGVTHRLLAAAGGLVATAALVYFGPYPVAMVGLVTNGVNNSQPPKVTLLTLAVFQAGLILALGPGPTLADQGTGLDRGDHGQRPDHDPLPVAHDRDGDRDRVPSPSRRLRAGSGHRLAGMVDDPPGLARRPGGSNSPLPPHLRQVRTTRS